LSLYLQAQLLFAQMGQDPHLDPTTTVSPTPTLEAITAKVIETVKGDLIENKPVLPAFYFWRRVYQKHGKSFYKNFLLGEDDSVKQGSEEVISEEVLSKKLMPLNYAGIVKEDAERVSPDGRWIVSRPELDDSHLIYKEAVSGKTSSVHSVNYNGREINPGMERWWFWGWSPRFNLINYVATSSCDTGRNWQFYEFNPETKMYTHIGDGVSLEFTSDGNWAV